MNLIIPATKLTGRRPTLVEYVESYLTTMRAPLRERTQFGPAGRAVIRSKGERIIFGPKGEPIHIIELPEGGNQIEHDDEHGNYRLHANIRPQPIKLRISIH